MVGPPRYHCEASMNKRLAAAAGEMEKGIADANRELSRLPSPVPIGTRVIATRNFGPIREGTPGIITGTTKVPFLFWQRFYYLCTFAENMKVAARPKEIDDFDHGRTLEDLENPNYADILLGRGRNQN
jgi:hypothetical protein